MYDVSSVITVVRALNDLCQRRIYYPPPRRKAPFVSRARKHKLVEFSDVGFPSQSDHVTNAYPLGVEAMGGAFPRQTRSKEQPILLWDRGSDRETNGCDLYLSAILYPRTICKCELSKLRVL